MRESADVAASVAIGTALASSEANVQLDLAQIQGNIIGFHKPFQSFLFLRFPTKGKEPLGEWLGGIAAQVTTGRAVLEFRRHRKAERALRNVTAPWCNIAFTHAGLEVLGVPWFVGFPEEFRLGMAKRAEIIGDAGASAPENWDFNTGGGQIHAVVLLAADKPDDLEVEIAQQMAAFREAGITLLHRQDGADRPEQPGHEHFGFKDGVSQPDFYDDPFSPREENKTPQERIRPGEFVIGYPREGDATAPRDDEVESTLNCTRNGSYLVFRRLRQNVGGFRKFVREKADELHIDKGLLMAKLVGRYPSGAPLARFKSPVVGGHELGGSELAETAMLGQSSDPGFERKHGNDFGYGDDPEGLLVPLAAHIRKVSPRDQALPGEREVRKRHLLRRGIPFGQSYRDRYADKEPSSGPVFPHDRGLLFVCYQSSIAEQFEFVQQKWANNPEFPQAGQPTRPGHDPIIGQAKEPREFDLPGRPPGALNPLPQWVTMTGGDYFFSPSVEVLYQLATYRKEQIPVSNPSLSRSADYRKPTYIDSAGSGLCSVLITVGIGNVPGIESSNSMWRARWAVLVRDTPVWWSSGYDDLCITAQGTLVGKAEIPVRKLLEALPSDLTVGDILRLTDPNLDHGEVLEAIISRARNSGENNIGAEANGAEEHVEPAGITELESTYGMRLEVSLDHGKRISLPINMGVSTW